MAKESVNGSAPTEHAPSNGSKADQDSEDGGTAFGRFESLTRKLVAVPKAEIEKKRIKAGS